MRSLAILTLTLLLKSTSCQSGSEPDGLFDDTEAETPEYECFIKLSFPNEDHKLTCFLKDSDPAYSNISFKVCCRITNVCHMLKPEKKKYALRSNDLTLSKECEICAQLGKKKQCKDYKLKNIVKPHAPTNVTITYQKEGKEYIIGYLIKPGLLTQNLFYQTAIREEQGKWKNCEVVKILEFRFLEQNLTRGVKYEVKVRSKPNERFFKGIWSDWSDPGYFETRLEDPAHDDGLQLMIIIISSVCVLLLTVVVFMVLWEKRIKPSVWPHIPDHKSTLEKLCKKQGKQNLDLSFNPDYFVDVHIHKVDEFQAKTWEDGLLDPSEILYEELAGESPSGSPLKMTLDSMSENVLVPPTVLTKNQPVVFQDAAPVDVSHANGYALDSSAPQGQREGSITVAQGYENSTTQTHTVNGTSTSPDHFRVSNSNPDQQMLVLLHNVIKAACQEDSYVSMSAFPAASIPR